MIYDVDCCLKLVGTTGIFKFLISFSFFRRVKWRCETQCLRMIKRPKLASRRVLLHHQFGDLISEFETLSFLLLYRHILQHILMISKTSMMKRKTLAELKKRKIYYHIIHNITIVTQIIQNWPKEKKFTLKYTPIGTPTRYPNKFGKLLKMLWKVKKFGKVCLHVAVSTNFWFFLKVACLVTLFDRKL